MEPEPVHKPTPREFIPVEESVPRELISNWLSKNTLLPSPFLSQAEKLVNQVKNKVKMSG